MSASPSTLVVAPAWVGDLVMAQPLIAQLARQDPAGQVDILAPGFVLDLCRRMPGVAQAHVAPFGHGTLAIAARWRLGRQLAVVGYQHAYVLPNSLKSALVPWFAGIPHRVGYVGEQRYGLLNDRHHLDRQAVPRMVDRYYHLAFPAQTLQPRAPDPVLLADLAQRLTLLERLGLTGQATMAPVVLCPGAEYGPAKRWPVRHFAQVAAHYLDRQVPVWILGSGKDAAVAEAIRSAGAAQAHNLCGRTSLGEAVDLMAAARAVITNDSGLMHVGAALGVRTVALFGSSSARFTPPLSPMATALSLDLACSPCFRRTCPLGHLHCLEHLLPEQVLDTLSKEAISR